MSVNENEDNNGFSIFVGEYLKLLNHIGIVEDLDHIDPDTVVDVTRDLLNFFESMQEEDLKNLQD